MEGSIKRVVMEDFMTYSKVVFIPGPKLNVIIGPNGTGKSTIVCAVMLGLGGKPKMLGRSTSIISYIRSGCDIAIIEIELANLTGPNHVITRSIFGDGRSSWLMNGTTTTQKQVEELVTKLNIQVDNLCQFLPQDRVEDFSKMNAQQVLENTEKCLGLPELFDYHTQLKELSKQLAELECQLENMSARLRGEEQRNNRIQVDVGNITEKKNLLEMIVNLKQKRAWVAVHRIMTQFTEMKADKKKTYESLTLYKRELESLKRIISSAKDKMLRAKSNLSTLRLETSRRQKFVTENYDLVVQTEDSIKENIQECDRKVQAEEKRQRDVSALMQQINKLENDLRNADTSSEMAIAQELETLKTQLAKKGENVGQLLKEREHRQNKLEIISNDISKQETQKQRVEDITNQRLELLRNKYKDAYQAVLWLRSNKNMFQHQIYEPMMLELNVTEQSNAKYVERVIPVRDLIAFTCESKDDMNKFLKAVRDGKNLKINAVHSGPEHAASSSYKPHVPIDDLRKFGFYSYVRDMFTAPESILKYLCRMHGIHKIPVGNERTYKCSEQIPRSINRFFTNEYHFSVNKSTYSGETFTSTSEISPARNLTISVDRKRLEAIQTELKNLYTKKEQGMNLLVDIKNKVHIVQKEVDTLRDLRKKKMEQMEQLRTVAARLKAKQNTLKALEQDKIDPDVERSKCKREIQGPLSELCKYIERIVHSFTAYEESMLESKIVQFLLDDVRTVATEKENRSHELQQKCVYLKNMVEKLEENISKKKCEYKKMHQEAKMSTNGFDPSCPEFVKFTQAFRLLSDTEEELDKEIQNSQAKADCLGEANEQVIQEFQDRQTLIASVTDTIQSKQEECNKLKKKMVVIREKWLPPLKGLISQISKKYGQCFAHLNCAGEVALVTGQDENDYNQYGLSIKVKYRDGEELQELSAHLQSGGERAVATAIYLISMQKLTCVPFCCADEINQGMDADNERKIFQLLVAATNQPGASQYFLLTPKLLPSLLYDSSMVIHSIYSGISPALIENWNFVKFVSRKDKLDKKHNS